MAKSDKNDHASKPKRRPSFPIDQSRISNRLGGLAYGTVTSLIMNASLGLYYATPKKFEYAVFFEGFEMWHAQLQNILVITFSICISTSISLAAYCTFIFTLMSIYSNTALGMGLDREFMEFFESCSNFRRRGFQAFVGSLMGYNFAFVCSILLKQQGMERWIIALPAMGVTALAFSHISQIMGMATKLIYSNKSGGKD